MASEDLDPAAEAAAKGKQKKRKAIQAEVEEPTKRNKSKKSKIKADGVLAKDEAVAEVLMNDPPKKVKKQKKKSATTVNTEGLAAGAEVGGTPEEPTAKKRRKNKARKDVEHDAASKNTSPKAAAKRREQANDASERKTTPRADNSETTVFFGGLPWACTETQLCKYLSDCGEIATVHMPLNDEEKPRGFAFVTFKTKGSAEAALKYDGGEFGGRNLKVNMSSQKPGQEAGKSKGKGDRVGLNDKVVSGGKGRSETTVCIRSLPFSADQDSLRQEFEQCGEIESVKLLTNDEGKPKGSAFIQFKEQHALDSALKKNGCEFGGRKIYVSAASEDDKGKGKGKGDKGKGKGKGESDGKGRSETTVCIRSLPFSADKESLRKEFEQFGEIRSVRLLMNEDGKPRGAAFIQYKEKGALVSALKKDGSEFEGRKIYVSPASEADKGKGKGDKGKGKGKGDSDGKGLSETTVCIRSLPFSADQDSLRKEFEPCGEIESVRLLMNDEGKPKGTAFIQYKEKGALASALKKDGSELGGRKIYVSAATERGDKSTGVGSERSEVKGKEKGKGNGKGKKGKAKGNGAASADNEAAKDGDATGKKRPAAELGKDGEPAPPMKKKKKTKKAPAAPAEADE